MNSLNIGKQMENVAISYLFKFGHFLAIHILLLQTVSKTHFCNLLLTNIFQTWQTEIAFEKFDFFIRISLNTCKYHYDST